MKRLLVGSAALALPVAAAFAVSSAVVSDDAQVLLNSDKNGVRNTLTMTSVALDAFPSELGTPIFWFDASQTNGWEVAADGTVVRVPSLVGNRYLTSDVTEPGTSWSTWKSGYPSETLKPPYFVSNIAALGGGNAIDFGPQKSGRGLLFNAVAQSDGTVKSQLETIGTVVAVYDSTDGGGFFLSGGKNNGMDWGRSYNYMLATASKGVTDYFNLFVNHKLAASNAQKGMYWQDDLFGSVANGGFGGQWQVIAYSPAATLPFTVGLGIGCTAEWYKEYSSGMKIAEMLIFDTVIADDDLHKLSIWLQNKWFGRSPAGYNAKARVGMVRAMDPRSGGRSAVVDVTLKKDETLSIESFVGGRAAGSGAEADVRVMGEGTLKVRDIRNYNGKVTLAGGTTAFGCRSVPTVETLPRGLFVRFDPSCDEGRTDVMENGTNYVKTLFNVSPKTFYGNQILARPENPSATGNKPALLGNELGEGLHVVDFGPNGSAVGSLGRCLVFATNETDGVDVSLPGVCTLVAVVGAQECGGNVLEGAMFRRYEYVRPNDGTHTHPLLYATAVDPEDGTKSVCPQKYGTVYIDGTKCASNAGYPTPSYHVIALQVPPCAVRSIGRYKGASKWRGGFRLGEMLLFNRPLSETELLDAQAYLMKKWFGRTLGGYRDATTAPDVQNVIVAEPSTIDVPAGETLHIGKLTARARLEKTGAGSLVVGAGSDTSGVIVHKGDLKVASVSPDVTDQCELAADDSFHLDANSLSRIEFMRGHADTKTVAYWNDENFRNCAYQMTSTSDLRRNPTLTTAAELNGKPVVDFGTYVDTTDHGVSRFMFMEKPLDSVRSIYMVIGTDGEGRNGGNPIGMFYRENDVHSDWGIGDFARSQTKAVKFETPWFSAANSNVKNGEIFINGERKTFETALPNGGYQLVEVHTCAGAVFSEIGRNLYYYDMGGFTLGELVVYERELTEREKIATRNYLMKKWFGTKDEDLTPLPEKPVIDPTVVEREIDVSVDMALDIANPRVVRKLKGSGTLSVTAAKATLAVDDLSDFAGTLAVTEGTVKLSGLPLAVAPKLLEAGRILHLDATRNVTVSTNEDHTVSVSEWASVLNDGWTAVPGVSYGDKKTHLPTLMTAELNDLPVVKMTYHGWTSGEEYMLFQKDGVQTQLANIRSVFWVIGSQEGGGFLLGGGSKNNAGNHWAAWARKAINGSRGDAASDPLIGSDLAQDDLYAWSDWCRNGEVVSPSADGLTGGYDVLSMVEWTTTDPKHRSWNPASADGLAFDGRILNGDDYRYYSGRQRLAELVIYDTYVTGEDRLATEAYLSSKWGLSQKCLTNAATVVLAAGTTLVSEKGSQYVGKLVGEGTVQGDVTVGAFVADAAATSVLSIDGTLTIPPAVAFDVRNLVFEEGVVTIPVCAATSCAGLENLRTATFTGLPDYCRARAKFRNGTLVVDVMGKGTAIIIR